MSRPAIRRASTARCHEQGRTEHRARPAPPADDPPAPRREEPTRPSPGGAGVPLPLRTGPEDMWAEAVSALRLAARR